MTTKLFMAFLISFTMFAPAQAHHSFAATYDVSQVITIEGKLVALQFRNPHVRIHVIVTDEAGKAERWSVEWGAASTLKREKITRDTLIPGDHVVIEGSPGRSGNQLRMNSIKRPSDGWEWSGEVK